MARIPYESKTLSLDSIILVQLHLNYKNSFITVLVKNAII